MMITRAKINFQLLIQKMENVQERADQQFTNSRINNCDVNASKYTSNRSGVNVDMIKSMKTFVVNMHGYRYCLLCIPFV